MAVQVSLFNDYDGFVEKFKPKKTTDDCYTPKAVYAAVLEYATETFELHGRPVVRPFWPGGDYEAFDYPDNCVVIDNPPFSLLAKIRRFYEENGIDFFLFAPGLTMFSSYSLGTNYVVQGSKIVYDNGAVVNTSFVTSLGDVFIRTAPELTKVLERVELQRQADVKKRDDAKNDYPENMIYYPTLKKIATVPLEIGREEVHKISSLESQRKRRKGIFGGGFLVGDQVAAKIEAAKIEAAKIEAAKEVRVWELSEREREIIRGLNNHD